MTRAFWRDLGERAGKSFVQGALATVSITSVQALGSNPLDLSLWQGIGTSALGGGLVALFSVLTSLASSLRTGTASASVQVAQTAVVKEADGTAVVVEPPYDARHDRPDDA